MEEIFKDIPNYEGYYQVSNLGNVKSLTKVVNGKSGGLRKLNELILKPRIDTNGYLIVSLCKDSVSKTKKIHKLVAICFLNHIPNGFNLVVNHKNFIRTDNRLENLEIVTMRENSNQKHLPSTSQFTGVCWDKQMKKWRARIVVKGKGKFLGLFTDEIDAANAYINYLKKISC